MENGNLQVKVLQSNNISALEDKVNEFLISLPIGQYVDMKAARSDGYTTVIVLYKDYSKAP
ncbi:hypothetical protein [Paenibacillus cymbidii]|uniref:hypothetical protein n=1 Tax=Paenibacillus cymbidii TaxID=1639034 RepID=UPI001081A3B9|nr:hypothetical protein [Paenibacillus cymbidii]